MLEYTRPSKESSIENIKFFKKNQHGKKENRENEANASSYVVLNPSRQQAISTTYTFLIHIKCLNLDSSWFLKCLFPNNFRT